MDEAEHELSPSCTVTRKPHSMIVIQFHRLTLTKITTEIKYTACTNTAWLIINITITLILMLHFYLNHQKYFVTVRVVAGRLVG